jgi:hypothetical protein
MCWCQVPEENFEGHPDRECGEHRTTGTRAWCFACSEWCYDTVPCKGCELPMLHKALDKLRELHVQQWHSTSDEVWGRPGFCVSCRTQYPCETLEILGSLGQ